MTLSIEVLPAPFGPMMARISPLRMSKDTSRSALHAAERQRDVLERQQNVARRRRAAAAAHRPAARRRLSFGGLPQRLRRARAG